MTTPPLDDPQPRFLMLSSDMKRIVLVDSEGQLTHEVCVCVCVCV